MSSLSLWESRAAGPERGPELSLNTAMGWSPDQPIPVGGRETAHNNSETAHNNSETAHNSSETTHNSLLGKPFPSIDEQIDGTIYVGLRGIPTEA